ncbi:MAG TPA: DsbA family oxidoreductase [Longimicrobiaceae bacterium]|nr:DsbA family oxidoreductase [Longimicrobiaceae bacterium]
MRIELFADIACPWCYIGERRLKRALQARGLAADVVWRPFQLQPGLPRDGQPWDAFVDAKFGGAGRAQGMFAHVAAAAAGDGIDFRFDRVAVAPNTRDAHRIMMLAGEKGLTWEMAEALFRAYFTDGQDVTRGAVLADLARAVGIAESETWAMLRSDRFTLEVDAGQARAAQLGVTGVPFFVFGDAYALSGAQSYEVMLQVLDQAEGHRSPIPPRG